jgi:hypothetical protein
LRKSLTIVLSLFLLLLFATPALAGVNLNINGRPYQTLVQPRIEEGTTMVPVYVVSRILGADVTSNEQNVDIVNNGQKLSLILNSKEASFNGETIALPVAPVRENGQIMVPLRAVMEVFGAQIDWQGESQTVLVNYQEERQGLSVEEMLLKSSEALAAYNTYKTKIDMTEDIQMTNPEIAGQLENISMKMNMDMAVQNQPLLVYGKTSVDMAVPEEAAIPVTDSEILLNEDGLYMTMPDQGWVRMNIPGIDIKAIMEQTGSQDPVTSLKQLQDAGAIMSFGNDQQKNGQAYWVLNVTMGPDSLKQVIQDALKSVPLPQDATSELDQLIKQVFDNMKADMVYSVWVNQDNYLTDYMQLDSDISLKMQIPVDPDQPQEMLNMDMNMKQKAFYEIYDLGEPFSVPDVSNAVDMADILPNI